MTDDLGAAGTSPPCVVLAGGDAASEPRRSYKKTPPWDEAIIARVRQMAAAGMSAPEAGKALGVDRCMMRYRAGVAGILFNSPGAQAKEYALGAAVLREHYATNPDSYDIHRRYIEAMGRPFQMKSINHHALRLGLTRGAEGLALRSRRGVAARLANAAVARVEKAGRLQRLLDQGFSRFIASRMLGFGEKATKRMLDDGLITIPPRAIKVKPPKIAKPPRVYVAKPIKVKAPRIVSVKPTKVAKPQRVVVAKAPSRGLVTRWQRAYAPPKPRVVFQTVAEWLAAGNTVTRCPAAMVTECSATISDDDKAAIRALYASREVEKMAAGDGWRQRSHRKNKGMTT